MDKLYDGYFTFYNKEDGFYIQIVPCKEFGSNVEIKEIIEDLENKGVVDYNRELLESTLLNLKEEIELKLVDEKIGDKNESLDINISQDLLKVYIRFFQPIGNGTKLTLEEIEKSISEKEICYGIDMDELEHIMENKVYNNEYVIAQGSLPTEGKDGEIEYLFNTNLGEFKPDMDEDGTINYHKLNLIINVNKGQELAKIIPETQGQPGKNVLGKEIPPTPVKMAKLIYGKNVSLSELKDILIAESAGQVKLEENKVVVYDYLEIDKNVDSSTGDIEFLGTVKVNGNVLTGFSVTATGDIEVYGVVEGAKIISEGNIILHRGVHGMDRGILKAKGNIVAKYIENSEIKAGGSIHSEAILHSNVSAKEEIVVEGKKGLISGGIIRSGKEIMAKTIGSNMGTQTIIEVGIDPKIIDKYNELEKEVKKLQNEEIKLGQIITLLNKRKQIQGDLDEEKKQMLITATRGKIFISSKLKNSQKNYENMSEELNNKKIGKVKVMSIAYPGVRISIGNVKNILREEIKFCTMYQEGADIKFTAYS